MDTSRTLLICICVLFITTRPAASETTATTGTSRMTATSPSIPEVENTTPRSSITENSTEGYASSVGFSTIAVLPSLKEEPTTASSTTQTAPGGLVGFSTATVTPTVGRGSANQSAETMDPKTTQPANQSAETTHPKTTQPENVSVESKSGESETGNIHGSADESHSTPKQDVPDNKKYLWILLPVGVAVVAVAMYFRYKFFKVHHHPETTDNGTENASFQRTESNRDGVTLLGVKSSGTEEGAAA